MNEKYIAVMQPYVFPYISYFHLAAASHVFVFYDDVQYIKRGWINRNRVLNHNEAQLFSIPVSKASQSKLINETELAVDEKWTSKFICQLTHAYQRAPYFDSTMDLVTSVIDRPYENIVELAIASIAAVFDYTDQSFDYLISSEKFSSSQGMDRADRLIHITKELGSNHYINSPGGKELYSKEYFREQGIELSFVHSNEFTYKQFEHEFVPGLSIIDILMFNEPEQIHNYFSAYTLI